MKLAYCIKELTILEQGYKPSLGVAKVLKSKNLVLIVGPAKVGKSTLMNRLVEHNSSFARIGGFTTRDPRPDDEPELYRYLPYNAASFMHIIDQVKAGGLVQYAVHPTTGNVYATELIDYNGKYNCKDVLGHAVSKFRALPSASCHTFSIVCEPAQWLQRMHASYTNISNPDLQKRLAEAKINLNWSLKDDKTIWIDNSNGKIQSAINNITSILTTNVLPSPSQQKKLRELAKAMLAVI